MVSDSDYYAALLRTQQAHIMPTQGKLLNYVQRVPLGVVAQITVRQSVTVHISFVVVRSVITRYTSHLTIQS
jgi:hypothetical protein